MVARSVLQSCSMDYLPFTTKIIKIRQSEILLQCAELFQSYGFISKIFQNPSHFCARNLLTLKNMRCKKIVEMDEKYFNVLCLENKSSYRRLSHEIWHGLCTFRSELQKTVITLIIKRRMKLVIHSQTSMAHFTKHVITYPCWELNQSKIIKEAHDMNTQHSSFMCVRLVKCDAFLPMYFCVISLVLWQLIYHYLFSL